MSPSAEYVVTAGEFPHPGLVPYTAGMTITQAVNAACGSNYNEFGGLRTIYLIRCGKKEKLDLKVFRQDPSKDLALQPWDIVFYPEPYF